MFQKCFISLYLVDGFTSRLINSFNSCHKFSIGFMSGDSAGVFHQFIDSISNSSLAARDVCLGSSSCISLWVSGKLE